MNPFEKLFPVINDTFLAPLVQERIRLLAHARGDVLELGMGTGLNLAHYGELSSLSSIEPSSVMRAKAEERAQELGKVVRFETAFAEQLPFTDESFDTVVSTFVLCSVRDLDRSLQEIRRVLRPGGRFLALEHVRSESRNIAAMQDFVVPVWKRLLGGCHPNRNIGPMPARQAGLKVITLEHFDTKQPFLIKPHLHGVWEKV